MGTNTHPIGRGKGSAMPQDQTSLLSQFELYFEANRAIKEERSSLNTKNTAKKHH